MTTSSTSAPAAPVIPPGPSAQPTDDRVFGDFIGTFVAESQCVEPYSREMFNLRIAGRVGPAQGWATLDEARTAVHKMTAPARVGAVAIQETPSGKFIGREVLSRYFNNYDQPRLDRSVPPRRFNASWNNTQGDDAYMQRQGYGKRVGVREVIDGEDFDFEY